MASSSPTRIVELAQTIERHARAIDAALAAHGEPSPSWDLQTPPVVGAGLQAIRESQDAILEASEELNALMLGPVPWLMKRATDAVSTAVIQSWGIDFPFALSSFGSYKSCVFGLGFVGGGLSPGRSHSMPGDLYFSVSQRAGA